MIQQLQGSVSSFRTSDQSVDNLWTSAQERIAEAEFVPSQMYNLLMRPITGISKYMPPQAFKGAGEYSFRVLNFCTNGSFAKALCKLPEKRNDLEKKCLARIDTYL